MGSLRLLQRVAALVAVSLVLGAVLVRAEPIASPNYSIVVSTLVRRWSLLGMPLLLVLIEPDGTLVELVGSESTLLDDPRGLAVDAGGNLWVAGFASDNVVRIILCGNGVLNGTDAPFCADRAQVSQVPALGPVGVLVLVAGIGLAGRAGLRRRVR